MNTNTESNGKKHNDAAPDIAVDLEKIDKGKQVLESEYPMLGNTNMTGIAIDDGFTEVSNKKKEKRKVRKW